MPSRAGLAPGVRATAAVKAASVMVDRGWCGALRSYGVTRLVPL